MIVTFYWSIYANKTLCFGIGLFGSVLLRPVVFLGRSGAGDTGHKSDANHSACGRTNKIPENDRHGERELFTARKLSPHLPPREYLICRSPPPSLPPIVVSFQGPPRQFASFMLFPRAKRCINRRGGPLGRNVVVCWSEKPMLRMDKSAILVGGQYLSTSEEVHLGGVES